MEVGYKKVQIQRGIINYLQGRVYERTCPVAPYHFVLQVAALGSQQHYSLPAPGCSCLSMQTYPLVRNSPIRPPPPTPHQNWPLKPSVPGQPALPLHPPAAKNNIILVIDLQVMQTKPPLGEQKVLLNNPSVNKSTIRCTYNFETDDDISILSNNSSTLLKRAKPQVTNFISYTKGNPGNCIKNLNFLDKWPVFNETAILLVRQ